MPEKNKEWISVLSSFVVLLIFSVLMVVMVLFDPNNDKSVAYFGIASSIMGTLWIMWGLYFLKLCSLPVCRRPDPDEVILVEPKGSKKDQEEPPA